MMRRSPPAATYQEVVTAIRETVGPMIAGVTRQVEGIEARVGNMEQKVSALADDRVKISDHQALRKEMHEGFLDIRGKYVEQAVADERYQSIIRRLGELETSNRDAQQNGINQRNYQINWGLTILTACIAALGLLLAAASHLQFHP